VARHVRARLYDIDQTISHLLASTQGRRISDLSDDWSFGQACHYALQTIGEAANNLPPELRARYPEVPWRKIISLSHMLRHEYFRIDADVIWEIVTIHLSPLQMVIKAILADVEQTTL
jgi:uncharacterized protein with HEPN domain